MGKRPKIGIGPMDASIVLQDGASLIGKHIVIGGAMYGRFLFTEIEPAVRGLGTQQVTITHCVFENVS